MWMDPGKILGAGTWIPAVFDQSGSLVGVSPRIPAEMSGAGLLHCAVASLTTTNRQISSWFRKSESPRPTSIFHMRVYFSHVCHFLFIHAKIEFQKYNQVDYKAREIA